MDFSPKLAPLAKKLPEKGTNQAISSACGHSWGGHQGPGQDAAVYCDLCPPGVNLSLAGKVQKGFL